MPLTQRARSYASGVNGTYSLRQERTERLPERLTLVEAAAIAEVHAGGLRSNQPRAPAAPLCGAQTDFFWGSPDCTRRMACHECKIKGAYHRPSAFSSGLTLAR